MLKLSGYPRLAVSIVASSAASVVVGNIVSATTPADLTKIQKINVKVGGYVVGAAAGAIAAKYMLEQIDASLDIINMVVAAAKAKNA